MLIARLLAETASIADNLDRAREMLRARGWIVAMAETVRSGSDAIEILLPDGEQQAVRAILDECFSPSDLIVSDRPFEVPKLFVSDMDSTMIAAECIDELADFAGIKPQIAAITERAMRGELEFEGALRERVSLLAGMPDSAITQCLDERIAPMPGARTLVRTLREKGCYTVLVTGGFHAFADPVAELLGFDRVVANRLEVQDGRLTGGLVGSITDSSVKAHVLQEEQHRLGDHTTSLAMGDGANDIPMLTAATWGVAYRAKPAAREAGQGWIERGDLTAVLDLFDIPRTEWVRD
ncbi:phosphoserine phosphatase SerB [Novosphingobium tardum]|uniref:Phosphoserine phosphatase n=1 Tax=Novosphingobium tardum TaxID=1538021 RepID=A0ABV8RS62_9SPHN